VGVGIAGPCNPSRSVFRYDSRGGRPALENTVCVYTIPYRTFWQLAGAEIERWNCDDVRRCNPFGDVTMDEVNKTD